MAFSDSLPEITTTYVWRVALCYEPSDSFIELTVMCDEQVPGEKFKKALEDTFYVYVVSGKVSDKLPHDLTKYVMRMTSLLGLAAGCTAKFSPKGVSIGELKNGFPVMLNAEEAVRLAGLDAPEMAAKETKVQAKENDGWRSKLGSMREHVEQVKDSKCVINELILDTATTLLADNELVLKIQEDEDLFRCEICSEPFKVSELALTNSYKQNKLLKCASCDEKANGGDKVSTG